MPQVLDAMRKLMAFEMTIAEWIGTALMLAAPYAVLGVVWTAVNYDRFEALHGIRLIGALIAGVLVWPVLLLPGVCGA